MVTAHIRQPGYRLKLYYKHWKILMVTEGIVDNQVINNSKQDDYAQLTIYSFCKELCSCLFVRQSNNKHYRRMKEYQHNAFLTGDNKHINKMVEANTLLKD